MGDSPTTDSPYLQPLPTQPASDSQQPLPPTSAGMPIVPPVVALGAQPTSVSTTTAPTPTPPSVQPTPVIPIQPLPTVSPAPITSPVQSPPQQQPLPATPVDTLPGMQNPQPGMAVPQWDTPGMPLSSAEPMSATTPPIQDYSKLDSPYLSSTVPQGGSPWDTPQLHLPRESQSDGAILSVDLDNADRKPPVNWLKTGVIAAVLFIALGGTGGAFYMIKSTTDSLTNAAKTQRDTLNEIINEADSAFRLVEKVEAGYEDPFEPSVEEANPFTEVTNPFDEIGY